MIVIKKEKIEIKIEEDERKAEDYNNLPCQKVASIKVNIKTFVSKELIAI
jgi:hypothetical protein